MVPKLIISVSPNLWRSFFHPPVSSLLLFAPQYEPHQYYRCVLLLPGEVSEGEILRLVLRGLTRGFFLQQSTYLTRWLKEGRSQLPEKPQSKMDILSVTWPDLLTLSLDVCVWGCSPDASRHQDDSPLPPLLQARCRGSHLWVIWDFKSKRERILIFREKKKSNRLKLKSLQREPRIKGIKQHLSLKDTVVLRSGKDLLKKLMWFDISLLGGFGFIPEWIMMWV